MLVPPPPDEPLPDEPPLGMLELEPPELPDDPPEEPEEPDEPPEDGLGMLGEGMLLEDEDWSTQPPTSSADVALTNVVCAAMTNSRRREWRVDIA